ncbi:MAG TPA: MFS transporter, partial [Gaiellaceae bacterium]
MTAAILRAGARTFLSVRKHRNYRLFFTGQVISNIGTWMQGVAQAWLVLSLTHSPFAVGILALCQFMPFTLFSLIAAAGVGVCFAVNAASYIAVLAGLLMMRPQEFHSVERRARSRTLYI